MDLAISDGKEDILDRGEQEWGKYYVRWIPNILSTNLFATGQQDPLLVEITIF